MARPERGKSLQDVLRERRGSKALLTVEQLRRRELERELEQTQSAAREAVDSWRATGRAVDASGRLPVPVYREILALDPPAYEQSRHWARRVRAQRTAAPACEVARCGEAADPRVVLLDRAAVGQEQPGRDLLTLCAGCERRARRLERGRGRLPGREELVALDPAEPLYDAAAIAALKARYARPPRRPRR